MKFVIMYLVMLYLVWCADDCGDDTHSTEQRIIRALVWPFTLHSWFTAHNGRLHRLLTLLWIVLISGWLLSLIWDRVP